MWWRCVERIALRGVVSHWMRRKREIDRLARDAARDGFTQLVVLGAGLDTLTFRMNDERVYERVISADHPATLAVVRAANRGRAEDRHTTGNLERRMSRKVELVALDLVGDDVCAVLAATAAFDPSRATLVVIEGVLMYLDEPAVASVLRSLATVPAPRLRLIASWMLAEPGQPIGFQGQSRLVPAWLRGRRESMLWGSTARELPEFLGSLGWKTTRLIDLDSEEPGGGADSRGLPSEKLVVAERCD